MTKAVLLNLCNELSVKGVNSNSTKATIIAAILAKYAENEESNPT